ncbi:DUF4179 domain-containing protein [Paenibacillus harenae]|uniref:DUF4179 domain-containing protein n=1 Tax=Paenibacillus harenae TaxID=306543 RepID=UPI00278FAA6E|nr:DUF4179 domain-containing protein [Paenibacillus harenae]MDQ0063934.1 hypothetical protein [Paenibacillus harenae]
MNDHEPDMELNRMLRQSYSPVPELVSSRVDETLLSLKKRNRLPRKAAVGVTAAVASLALLVGSSFVSPTIAGALTNTPLIGSVFEMVGDAGLQLSGQKGIATKLNQAAEDKGIRMTVTDVLYDGIRLAIGYTIEAEHFVTPSNAEMLINGEPVETLLGGGGSSEVGNNQYTGYLDYEADGTLPDQFELTLKLKGIQHYSNDTGWQTTKGSWNFRLPVSKLTEGITVRSFDETPPSATSGETTLSVKKVTMTPAITAINVELAEKSTVVERGFFVYDDKGQQLQYSGYRGYSDYSKELDLYKTEYRIHFSPIEALPEFLVIKPYKLDTSGKTLVKNQTAFDPELLPIALTQGGTGTVTITEAELLPDKTVLHFKVEGLDPFNQANSFWLEDGNGELLTKLGAPKLADRSTYSFTQEYAPLQLEDSSGKSMYLAGWKLPAPAIWDELAVKIPVK